jgi:hypothetical protein
MMNRRALFNGTALGGALLAANGPVSAARSVTGAEVSDRELEEVVKAVRAIGTEMNHQATFWEIAAVREPIRTFLKANLKFPDYLDVGIDVWQQVYDWHVRFQQPLTLGRTPEGRMTVLLLATTIVMRPEQTANYIGLPYDSR